MKTFLLVPALAILSAFTLLIGTTSTVNAAHHGDSMFSANLSAMDSNNDEMVSFEEYSDYHSEKLRWSFNALDSNNDGSISEAEWETFKRMHGAN